LINMTLIAVYFVVIPILLALMCYPLGRAHTLWRNYLALAGVVVNLIIAFILLIGTVIQGELAAPLFSIVAGENTLTLGLTINSFGATISLILAIVLLAVVLHTGFVTTPRNDSIYFSLLFLTTAGLNGFVASSDLFGLYVFGELISFSFAFLVISEFDTVGMDAGLKLFITNEIAGFAFLWGILLTLAENQAIAVSSVANWLAQNPTDVRGWIGILFLGALATRIGLVPVHTWLTSAVNHSSFGIGSLLTGAVNLVGAYTLLRLMAPTFLSNPSWQMIIGLLGIATLVVGLYSALRNREIRHTLANLSIAQYGFFALILSIGNGQALASATWYLLALAFIIPFLFLSYGVIERFGTKLRSNTIQGWPLFAMTLMAGISAASGVLPFLGFTPRIQLFQAGLDTPSIWSIIVMFVGLAGIALNFWVWARLGTMFITSIRIEEPPTSQIVRPIELSLAAFIVIIALLAIPDALFNQFVNLPFAEQIGQTSITQPNPLSWQAISGIVLAFAGLALGGLAYALESGILGSRLANHPRMQRLRPVGQVALPLVDGWWRWADAGRFDLYHLFGTVVFSLSRLVSTILLIVTRRLGNW
jgi:formate hydrogenlyase subunit 3/multisubunit Na+/H+ antiporter MnhD subunit